MELRSNRPSRLLFPAASLALLLLLLLLLPVAAQTLYRGKLVSVKMQLMTYSRCVTGAAVTADTIKENLPFNKRDIDLALTGCAFATWSGKLTFTFPDSITAEFKDDSVLVFQSPEKITVRAAISGSGNQSYLIDSTNHSHGAAVMVAWSNFKKYGDVFEKCPDWLVGDEFVIDRTGPFTSSAAAGCDEYNYIYGVAADKARKDTLYSVIVISSSANIRYADGTEDYYHNGLGMTRNCLIIANYLFIKKSAVEEIGVWQDIPFYSELKEFSGSKDDNQVEMDGKMAEIITASPDSIIARVPVELVGDRNDVTKAPGETPRDITVVVRVKRQGVWREIFRRIMRFIPPRPLLYDEVTRANPPLLQAALTRSGARGRQAWRFLGSSTDGTATVRLLNTSTALAPLTLYGKVISPGNELFDKSPNPSYGNYINIGIGNAGIQFPVSLNGWYVIVVEGAALGQTPGSAGPLPAMYQIHLAGNAGLPRKLINGAPEPPRAIRLDTYFNHPAPRSETLVNAGTLAGSWAETGLFKFANPVSVEPFAIAALLPPSTTAMGFPLGTAPVRAPGPARIGQFPNAFVDPSTPMAQSPAVLTAAPGTVLDMAQVPIPASVVAAGPPGGIGAILGANDGNSMGLPWQGYSTVIADMGSGQEIIDASGADLRIHATGSYNIAVGNTPFADTFVPLGSGSGTQDFDLAGSSLTSARYVRINATSASLDAVQALNFLANRFESYGPVSDVASATITLRRGKHGTNRLDPMLELIAPDGSALGKNESGFGDDTSVDRSDAALINMTLTQSGFHRYLGRGYDTQPDEQAFGTFYTRLETGGSWDKVEASVSSQNEAQTAAQKQGLITALRQRDSYLFQAAPGTTIHIAVNGTGTTPLPDPLLELYDPEDFLIAANDDYPGRGKRAALSLTLPSLTRSGSALPNPSTWRVAVSGIDGAGSQSTPSKGSTAWNRQVRGGHYELKLFTGSMDGGSTPLQPVITLVTPSIIARGSADVLLTITGQNFTAAAVPAFSGAGITVKSVTFISAAEIQAVISLAENTEPGYRDLTITQGPGQSAMLASALQVRSSLGKIFLSWQAPPADAGVAPPGQLTARYGASMQKAAGRAAKTAPGALQSTAKSAPGNTRSAGGSAQGTTRSVAESPLGTRRTAGSDQKTTPPAAAAGVLASEIDEVEPNNSPAQAQILPPDSTITLIGNAEVADEGDLTIDYEDGSVDDIEDLFQIHLSGTGLSLFLYLTQRDCDLYLFDADAELIDYSAEAGDDVPEWLDLPDLEPGYYYLGVSIYDPDLLPDDVSFYVLDIHGAMGGGSSAALAGFSVYRSTAPSPRSSGALVANLPAEALQYADAVLHNGPWYYQVTANYADGSSAASNEAMAVATRVEVPPQGAPIRAMMLQQNYPNPFNPRTAIRFFLPERRFVRMEIFDLLGERHLVLLERNMESGEHVVEWNGANLPSGLYFCRLSSGAEVKQIKMLLLR